MDPFYEPEFCPQALLEWHEFGAGNRKSKKKTKSFLSLRAKKHLSYVGWTFKFAVKNNGRPELRYVAPEGKMFASLKTACEYCFEKGESDRSSRPAAMKKAAEPVYNGVKRGRKRKSPSHDHDHDQSPTTVEYCFEKEESDRSSRPAAMKKAAEPVSNGEKRGRKRKSPWHDHDQSPTTVPEKQTVPRKQKMVKGSGVGNCRTSKSRQVTKISRLIESKVVLENTKVQYRHGSSMKTGRITRDGIWCNCCNEKFGLNGFEVHAGSTFRRPAACTFLEDGRSLSQCNMQALSKTTEDSKSDDLCSICHEGGDLLLCDRCPSVFHLNCLGLEEIPNGQWFCPSCRCGLCGGSEFNENKDEFTENSTSVCDQCEHEFHVGCLRRRGFNKLKACPGGNWFCSKKCEKIFLGLHEILGKSIPVENSDDDDDNLSWTILRYNSHESFTDTMMEFHAKLNVALGIMHESFEPIHEPFTNSDLVEDVIFSRRSELKRLNFRGFYTVLLERGDDVICVATLRVHGEKVAEVPLVATQARHRRQGMCRILMDAIEKKLVELGVKRLVLPAAGQVVNTWIDHFGFSKIMEAERKKFLSYTFLDFQKSTMCQKLLTGTRNHSSSKRDPAMRCGGAIPFTSYLNLSLIE